MDATIPDGRFELVAHGMSCMRARRGVRLTSGGARDQRYGRGIALLPDILKAGSEEPPIPVSVKWSADSRRIADQGGPTDNVFVESFNGRLREECLNAHWFLSLADARAKIEAWRGDYSESRPHTSLGWLTRSNMPPRPRSR